MAQSIFIMHFLLLSSENDRYTEMYQITGNPFR